MARKTFLLVLALSLCSLVAMAQSTDYFRIARLSYLEGKVSFQHTDEVDWTAASINMALQPGDRIYAGDNGRAEIEFDDGSVLRLAEKTDVEILAMKEDLIQLRVLVGLCSLTGRSNVEFEIDTPAAAFTTSEKGSYRFSIAENGDSDGIVGKGVMDAVNNRFSKRISSGEVLHVPASDAATEVMARYDQRDAWDEWTDRRNAEQTAVESRRYIADSVYYGVSDLDRYGQWVTVDSYGPAWVPTMGMGWSPYWDGRWCYRPNWGWTWVSYEPWGWLPYHYGRWYNSASVGWCWIPGPSFGFNFFSPALVRFYRGGDMISWCPLGPGDYYNVNNYYFNLSRRSNVYYLNEMRLMQRRSPDDLINRRAQGAFRSASTDQFVNASLGGKHDMARAIQDPRQAGRIVTDALDVRPTARSFAPAPDRAVERPNVKNRPVVVRTEPQVRSRSDRYVPITNPQIAVPRARSEQQPARDLRSQPVTGGRTQVQQDRGGATPRSYQAPQSRAVTGGQQAQPSRPAYSQRDAQALPGQRQETMQRSQQAPAGAANSRMSPSAPVSRSGGGTVDRGYSGGSMGSGSQGSSSGRTADRSSASSSSVSRSAPTRSESSRPAAAAPPPASSSAPVKKMPERPERPMTSSYAPRAYQTPGADYRARPSNAAGRESQSYARSYSSPATTSQGSYGNVRSYAGYERPSASASSRAAMSAAPRSAAPQYSAPRYSAAPQAASRSQAQRSASGAGQGSSNRRVR